MFPEPEPREIMSDQTLIKISVIGHFNCYTNLGRLHEGTVELVACVPDVPVVGQLLKLPRYTALTYMRINRYHLRIVGAPHGVVREDYEQGRVTSSFMCTVVLREEFAGEYSPLKVHADWAQLTARFDSEMVSGRSMSRPWVSVISLDPKYPRPPALRVQRRIIKLNGHQQPALAATEED